MNYDLSNIFVCARLVWTQHVTEYFPKTVGYPKISTANCQLSIKDFSIALQNMQRIINIIASVFRIWSYICPWTLSVPRSSVLEQIMSADKFPCIFSRQIETIVYFLNFAFEFSASTFGFNIEQHHAQPHSIIDYYYTLDLLWELWLVESIQSIYNSGWSWHDN